VKSGDLIEKSVVHCSDLSGSRFFSFSWKHYRAWNPQFWNFGEIISTAFLQTSISRSLLEFSASGIQIPLGKNDHRRARLT
jgi:hypothetical protein